MMYTAREFRDNMRQALNEVEQGREVLIKRHKSVFRLQIWKQEFITDGVSSDIRPDMPTRPDEEIAGMTIEPIEGMKIPKVVGLSRTAANGSCKIHGTPLTDNGKCLQKGCKYA